MKWTDEVHVQRTIAARKEARLVGRGGEPQGKGHAHLAAIVAVSGKLILLLGYLVNTQAVATGLCRVPSADWM